MLEWREGRRRGEEGQGTACQAWQVKVRSRALLQVPPPGSGESRAAECLMPVLKEASEVRMWRLGCRTSKTG